jgi:hypothetical protein
VGSLSRCAPLVLAWRRLVTLAAVTLITSACAGAPTPDVVIRNARVFTNDATQPWAEAVAVKGERVVAVGESAALAASAGPSTRVIDAGGRVLVPGFNDARVDLPLEPPTAASLSALDRDAIAHGVTSLQVVAGGPMRALVAAAQQAQRAARWRLIRAPMDGERPQDEEPFLPPQPGVRLVANGAAWTVGRWDDRRPVEPARIGTILTWAYGAEDPVIVALRGDLAEGGVGERGGREELAAVLHGLGQVGVRDVWRRKRPRLDIYGRVPIAPGAGGPGFPPVLDAVTAVLHDLAGAGMAVVVVPRRAGDRHFEKDIADFAEPFEYARAGLAVGLGSGRSRALPTAIADVRDIGDRSREATVVAATLGGAQVEKAERDKGWLGPGTLADLAILSDDLFTAPADRLGGITSVLTMVGGAIVYDAGVLPR